MTATESPAQPSVNYQPCVKCGDNGFTGQVPGTPEGWLAKDVFELGIPCTCPFGDWFSEKQIEWRREK